MNLEYLIINIKQEEYELLNAWTKENKQLAKLCGDYSKFYFKKCKIVFDDIIYALCEVANNVVKITIHALPKNPYFAKIKLHYTPEDENDYGIEIILGDTSNNNTRNTILCVANAYLNINAYFFYANVTEDKDVIIFSKSNNADKIFTLKKFEERLYCVQTTAHKSPEGIFSVRGHFRRYKDGKVIWIDEYLKGVNND